MQVELSPRHEQRLGHIQQGRKSLPIMTGQTTREAALVASDGDALGVDIDGGMIARARELADSEGRLSELTTRLEARCNAA
jgi:hypothetical protein